MHGSSTKTLDVTPALPHFEVDASFESAAACGRTQDNWHMVCQ